MGTKLIHERHVKYMIISFLMHMAYDLIICHIFLNVKMFNALEQNIFSICTVCSDFVRS